jgi:hypothetical protein
MKIWKNARSSKGSLAHPDFACFLKILQQGYIQAAQMYKHWNSNPERSKRAKNPKRKHFYKPFSPITQVNAA